MIEFKPLVGIASIVALTVSFNLMLKLGAMVAPAQRVLFGIFSWQSVASLALFGMAGIIYAFVLPPCHSMSVRPLRRSNMSRW